LHCQIRLDELRGVRLSTPNSPSILLTWVVNVFGVIPKFMGDLLVGTPYSNKPEHLKFASCERAI
jgi:hypothetical protein